MGIEQQIQILEKERLNVVAKQNDTHYSWSHSEKMHLMNQLVFIDKSLNKLKNGQPIYGK
jgi:hypothetical protein